MTLPDGWRIVQIGEVAETALGKMLDKGRSTSFPRVRYLRNVNVQWGRIDTHDLYEMELADADRARFGVEPGDLLVCEGGEVGRSAIWRGDGEYIAFQKALHRIRPSAALDTVYLRYALELAAEDGTLERHSTGSTIAHLPQQQLRRVLIPLPPLDEQHRIVEILEEHLSNLDAGENALVATQKRAEAWFESTLRTAFSGGYPVSFTQIFETTTLPQVNVEVRVAGNRGRWPVVDQGVEGHGLRSDDARAVYAGELPVIIFGDHTRRVKLVREEFAVGGSGVKLIRARPGVEVEYAFWAARAVALPARGYGRHFALLRSSEFRLGPAEFQKAVIEEMRKAGEVMDATIRTVERARKRVASLHRALLQAAFSGQLTGRPSDLDRAEELVS